MNSESKDALQNLILLIVLSSVGLVVYFVLIYLSLFLHAEPETSMKDLLSENSLFEKLDKTGLIAIQITSHILVLILPAFFLTKLKKDVAIKLNSTYPNWKYLVYSLIFFICSIPLTSLLGYLNQHIPMQDWMSVKEAQVENLLKKLISFDSPIELLMTLITVSVIPAIAEEWIFRGIVQNQLLRFFKNHWVALLLSAIIFSLAHFQFEGLLPRFGLGLLLGIVYYYGNNLSYSMAIHGLFNGVQVIALHWYGIDSLDDKKLDLQSLLPICILSFFLSYTMFKILKQHNTSIDA